MPSTRAEIERDFDRIAALELAVGGGLTAAERWLLTRVPAGPGLAIDLGAGTGRFACALAERGLTVIALDLSSGMLAATRRRSPTLAAVRADVAEPPLRPGSCRCVTALAVLHHLPDPAASLRNWAQLLAPGGILLVQDVLHRKGVRGAFVDGVASVASFASRAGAWLSPTRRALRAAYAAHGAEERYLTKEEARTLARDAGLVRAELREHLWWRYSLVWRKPNG